MLDRSGLISHVLHDYGPVVCLQTFDIDRRINVPADVAVFKQEVNWPGFKLVAMLMQDYRIPGHSVPLRKKCLWFGFLTAVGPHRPQSTMFTRVPLVTRNAVSVVPSLVVQRVTNDE